MARLVAVRRSEDYPFERRQIPLSVDDNLTMVVQFDDTCDGCGQTQTTNTKELERFVQKFRALSSDELTLATMVTDKEMFNLLAQMIPCVGCRRSVERLFGDLVKSGNPALEPMLISTSGCLSIKRDFLKEPKAVHALFYLNETKMQTVIGAIPKSKKNKRCALHSLDTHKSKTLGSWIDIWDVMSQECREEVILVDCDSLMGTLDSYLRKHRFCAECKSKVLRAYSLLVGEVEKSNEKGYCPALYDGLKCCTGEKHIHVLCETDFIAHLIGRAEPELTGSRRERHAKTLDIAQEEVLTCLGIYLYERLFRIWLKLRAEEQTWQILYFFAVDSLRKSFEMAVEKKQGISNLELTCRELLEEEQAKEQRRVQKRQKKKKKKTTKANDVGPCEEAEEDELICTHDGKENCKCDENINIPTTKCASCDDHGAKLSSGSTCQCPCPTKCTCSAKGKWHGGSKDTHWEGVRLNHDHGYSSGHDCENSSIPSSQNGSDIACSEGICNHDGDSVLCQRVELEEGCRDCSSSPTASPTRICSPKVQPTALSLADMLEEPCFSGKEDRISEEEIQAFKANQTTLATKRQELREKLKQRFANLVHHAPSTECEAVAEDVKKLSVD